MAADVAEFLWKKSLATLEDAEAELPITASALRSFLGEIKGVTENKDWEKIRSSSVFKFRLLLDELNDVLGECRIFGQQSGALKKNWLRFNPVTELIFVYNQKGKLTKLKKDLEEAALREVQVQPSESNPPRNEVLPMRRQTICGESVSEIFGLDSYNMIEDALFSDGVAFKAIGIFGIGGIGKTTLVRRVFNSARVREEFPLRIWVCLSDISISNERDIESALVKSVLQALPVDGRLTSSNTSFVEHLRFLNGQTNAKKYLIVLDNVWEIPKFCENLNEKVAKQTGTGKGSCHGVVIVTSRLREVTRNMVGERYLFPLQPLTDQSACWKIFEHALPQGSEISPKIKHEIMYQCHGLPLAARTLANIVSSKNTSDEFRKMLSDA